MYSLITMNCFDDDDDDFAGNFVLLRHFQHCIGHITMGSFMGRENQYMQLVKVLYCKRGERQVTTAPPWPPILLEKIRSFIFDLNDEHKDFLTFYKN